jgi:hypothetical protein
LLEKKKKSSFKARMDISARTLEQGKLIHHNNVEKKLRAIDEIDTKRKQSQVDELMAKGFTAEEAADQINRD